MRNQHFSYIVPDDIAINKRFSNSLKKLQEKVDKNEISYPALIKRLSEFEKKYTHDYLKIKIHLEEPMLSWLTIDEIEAKAKKLDGNYLLRTNRNDLKQDEIWNLYIMLTRIESAFKDLKSYPGLQPNNHQIEKRVDGHVFISILAYHLLHSIEYSLRQKGVHSRWATIKRVVSTHNYSGIQLPTTQGTVINVRKPGLPEAVHIDIYEKAGIDYNNLPIRKNLA